MSAQEETIAAALKRAPEWLRWDLLSDDHVARAAAEEALSAMIASALAPKQA
jgi:hypothetical protein